jgi:hypothetical protein
MTVEALVSALDQPKIVWMYEDEEDFGPNYDLVGSFMGYGIDVIRCDVDGLWSVSVNNRSVKRDIEGREEARKWISDRLGSIRSVVDLMSEGRW